MCYITCYNEGTIKIIILKECLIMKIAFWYLQDKYIKGEINMKEFGIIESAYDTEVTAETEKAVYVKFLSELGTCETWIPKKCILEKDYRRAKVKMPKWLSRAKQLPKDELKGQILDETDKAIYFRYRIDLASWLPKSQITIEEID